MRSVSLILVLMVFPAFGSESAPDQVAQLSVSSLFARFQTTPDRLRTQVPGQYDSRCVGDHEDPLDFGVVSEAGEFRGECMDISSNRPPVILAGDELSPTITIGNLRYRGQFWIATFKREAIKDVQFSIIAFGTMKVLGQDLQMAHTQVRFLFNSPIELESQVVSGAWPKEKRQITDFSVTFNAFGPNGQGYDAQKGLKDFFGLVGKPTATVDVAEEEIAGPKQKVAVYSYDWSHVDAVNGKTTSQNMHHYLVTTLRHSQEMGYSVVYNSFFRNCTTEAFDVLDEAFPELLAVSGTPGSHGVPFVLSYFPHLTQNVDGLVQSRSRLLAKLQTDRINNPFPYDSKYRSTKAAIKVIDNQLAGYAEETEFKKYAGILLNIHDLVIEPSIQNLLDRGLLKNDASENIVDWIKNHTRYMNDEPEYSSADVICAEAKTCEHPNARSPESPKILTH